MRKLFLVFAKLLGLIQLYWAMLGFLQLGYMLTALGRESASEFGQVLFRSLGSAFYFVLSLGAAWILLRKTEWLADKLNILDDAPIEGLDRHPVLPVGVKLIGVYVTVYAIPALVQMVLEPHQSWDGQMLPRPWDKIIAAALQLALGLYLLLKSEAVVALLARKADQTSPPPGV